MLIRFIWSTQIRRRWRRGQNSVPRVSRCTDIREQPTLRVVAFEPIHCHCALNKFHNQPVNQSCQWPWYSFSESVLFTYDLCIKLHSCNPRIDDVLEQGLGKILIILRLLALLPQCVRHVIFRYTSNSAFLWSASRPFPSFNCQADGERIRVVCSARINYFPLQPPLLWKCMLANQNSSNCSAMSWI